ncbi:phytase [candidate division KSB1 bacterium]|nr:phytase [candidate division KSB1 bacterium]NIR70523.1 phytase [candidate division KSB1 bacterium]NIS26196.1 phytase [candidate division KSB1 bacterium]NIT72974.1 phytase [candidate division KSB1 bacterium]NIU26843.1 phytase [candidate division KSB1 bacterium]
MVNKLKVMVFFCLILLGKQILAQTSVDPVVSTSPTDGNADDPTIWIHPGDASKSLIIGMDKDAGVYVWDMNGNELQHIDQGTSVNNIDLRYGMQLGGQLVDIVVANLRDAGKLAVFRVNPNYSSGDALIQIADKNSSNNDIQEDSYGVCLYRRKSDGFLYVFERPKGGGKVRQYLIKDDGSGNGVTVTSVRDLNYDGGTAEGFVADDELGFVYVTEEEKGIHKYHADPEKSSERIAFFAEGDGIDGDREGLALYACNDGTGYLVLSSQGNSTIKIYERQGDNRFVKTVVPLDDNGNGGLGTDGLDVTSFAAPPNLPNGFVVVHDEHASKYHVYDWAKFAENQLKICVDGGDGEPPVADTTPPAPPANVSISVDE